MSRNPYLRRGWLARELRKRDYCKCATCRQLPWLCRCPRTPSDVSGWLLEIASKVRRAADQFNVEVVRRKP